MSKSKADLNWTDAKTLPPTPNKVSPITEESNTLLIISGGKVVPGYYLRYTKDVNAPHINKKKGEGLFIDMHQHPLTDVTAYYPTKDLAVPKKEVQSTEN